MAVLFSCFLKISRPFELFWKIALCVRSALLILTEESWIWELPMTIIGLYFHLAAIIISLTYLNGFALVSVFFVFFTNIVTRLFEDEKSIIIISSVVGTLMPFGGFMDNAIKTVLYTINLGNFHAILHTITFLFSVPLQSSTNPKSPKPNLT